jgi:hypothetical protein
LVVVEWILGADSIVRNAITEELPRSFSCFARGAQLVQGRTHEKPEKIRLIAPVVVEMKVIMFGFLLTLTSLRGEPAAAEWRDLFNGKDLKGWVDVNTSPETWSVRDGLLVCTGLPIGVMRSDRQYENFILHIEWRHMKPGGNSGVFVWSDAKPTKHRLPMGMEVQMLELEWIHLNPMKDGSPNHPGYISGELFGANGLTCTPENPRGSRSMSTEFRCKPHGEWNTYVVVCVDGTVKLSINGKFVNGVRNSSLKKGYLCLESEGSEIHFRNIRIMELPPGNPTAEQTAPE